MESASRRPAHRRGGRRLGRKRRLRPVQAICLLVIAALAAAFVLRRKPTTIQVPVPEQYPEWVEEQLLPVNDWSRPGTAMDGVNGIVVHYVGNPGTSAGQNRSYFAGLAQSHETYASSHFLVGLEGEVLLCVPLGEVAYCSSDRNHDTISIEVCHPDDTGEFTPESYAALVRLVDWLEGFYGLSPEDVIRHYDVTGKLCPRYYVEHPGAWEAFQKALAEEEAVRKSGEDAAR